MSRGKAAETLRRQSARDTRRHGSSADAVREGRRQVTEHCNVLRSDIQLATESAIEQMQACSDELVRQVDLFEKSCRDEYSSDKHFEKTLKEVQYIYPLPIDH